MGADNTLAVIAEALKSFGLIGDQFDTDDFPAIILREIDMLRRDQEAKRIAIDEMVAHSKENTERIVQLRKRVECLEDAIRSHMEESDHFWGVLEEK